MGADATTAAARAWSSTWPSSVTRGVTWPATCHSCFRLVGRGPHEGRCRRCVRMRGACRDSDQAQGRSQRPTWSSYPPQCSLPDAADRVGARPMKLRRSSVVMWPRRIQPQHRRRPVHQGRRRRASASATRSASGTVSTQAFLCPSRTAQRRIGTRRASCPVASIRPRHAEQGIHSHGRLLVAPCGQR